MNNYTFEKLHYEELKEIVKSYCVSGLGKALIDKLMPSGDLKTVSKRLKDTDEARKLLDASYHIPLEGIFNIFPIVEKIEKGASLEPSDLNMISDFLRGCRKIKTFMKDKSFFAPTLSSYSLNISEFQDIEDEINHSIKGNKVDSNASKELRKIRRKIDECEANIKERLEKFLKSPSNKEYIQEFFISKRDDKYTIPIKSAYKNSVQGSIIESSAKGNTVFIEPSSISKFTVELSILKSEESVEEYRILAELTELIYENIREIKINIEVIAEYDMIWSKAKYSKAINAVSPKLNSNGFIKIVNGKYPLIKNSVPLNFEIGKSYRSLIITGPNAGGKTVVLKTIGLMTLAVQSGLPVAFDIGTEFSVFEKIFVDIGDNQSIENALSTFSSHVKNIADILRESKKSTLLLFDEIGSGTEPSEGAALAIALLEEFYKKGCITIATTHYGEIKNFSSLHPDFENAAMEFDSDTLNPLYKMHIGISGNSNALYISKKMGIPDSIIEKSRNYHKSKNYNFDTIIPKPNKINPLSSEDNLEENSNLELKKGDRVTVLENMHPAIVYTERDKENNIVVLEGDKFKKYHYKRLKLELTAEELYPRDYDLDQIFVSFKDRKLEHDIQRGSKKAIKQIQKEIRNSKINESNK